MHHLSTGHTTINSTRDASQERKQQISPGGSTCQERPPEPPREFNHHVRHMKYLTTFGFGQKAKENPSLIRPTASNFSSHNHQAISGAGTNLLWEGGLFPLPRLVQHGTIKVRGSSVCHRNAKDTNVVPTAKRTPPNKRGPSATISDPPVSLARGIGKSGSLTIMFCVSLAPPSR